MLVAFSFVRCKFVEAYSESCGNSKHIRRKHSGSEKAFVAKVIATVTRADVSRREEASIEAAQVLP
ncbi:hypothetical protein CQJ30_03925 [Caldibacillus thermoamylovorans]|nr:hypothetical protein CQJ30_03925 [Caldibacillus thermoamylovorans]PAC34415.1 hypothetical protein CEJ87_13610 [Caldifermentibacillus hisashii]